MNLAKRSHERKEKYSTSIADGGAEWVEISNDTIVHRVTFEYMHEPRELASIVPRLREKMNEIEGCDD